MIQLEDEASFVESNLLSFYEAPNITPMKSASLFHVVQTGAYTSPYELNAYVKKLLEAGIYSRVIEDKFSYIYTGAYSNKITAQLKAEVLNQQGFDSYVKDLPYRITLNEIELLLSEASDVISVFNGILSNVTPLKNYELTKDQINSVGLKIKAYDEKVQLALETSKSESKTLVILSELQRLLLDPQKNMVPNNLGKAEGLILDFMLIFNGYVPSNVKGS